MTEKFRVLNNNGSFVVNQAGIRRQEFDPNGVPVYRQGKDLDPVGAPCNCNEEEICARYYTTSSCQPDQPAVNGVNCYTYWRPYFCINGKLVKGAIQSEACGSWSATSQVCAPLLYASIDTLP